jgi:amidase
MSIVVLALSIGEGSAEIMVKDTIDVAGHPTRAGSRALEHAAPAAQHAQVVHNLLMGGWRLTGKTNMHELAFGTTGLNAWTGTPTNPRYPALVPGGSSSGSAAAVASGLVPAALGTDTGGSVRTPAACCGVFGFKPTFGRVSRAGVMPAKTTLDCVGPLACDMGTLIKVMQAIDPSFGPLPVVEKLLLGALDVNAHPEIKETLRLALKASGFDLAPASLSGMSAAYDAGLAIINAENWAACGSLLASGKVGADVAHRLQVASQTDAAAVQAAEVVRQSFTAEVDRLLQHFDLLVLPTMQDFPPRVEDATNTLSAVSMTTLVRPFNLSGHPALTLPLESPSGLPVGLQLVGRRGADEFVCAAGAEIARRLHLSLAIAGVVHDHT